MPYFIYALKTFFLVFQNLCKNRKFIVFYPTNTYKIQFTYIYHAEKIMSKDIKDA